MSSKWEGGEGAGARSQTLKGKGVRAVIYKSANLRGVRRGGGAHL